jgi:type II secretory pathway component GspD/PulD (secretin)
MTPKTALTRLALGLALAPAGFAQQDPAPPPAVAENTTGRPSAQPGLRFNFRGAPFETVLNYMSEAAGYVIVLETPVRGTLDMWSAQPVSREEAVQLLILALNKNGYTATVQGRNLIVSSKDDAKKRNIPIRTGNDPREIPETAEMVMQIIPLRHIDAAQAASDLGTLFPSSATVTTNQDSNSIVVTDTQINVRHIVTLLSALDTSSDSVSTMRIFRLRNADPNEMASLLTSLFGTGTTGAAAGPGAQIAAMLAARGGAAASASGRSSRSARRSGPSGAAGGNTDRGVPVTVVPDPRTYSVIVTADRDEMPVIAETVAQLDSSDARKQKVFVYTLENADVRQVENVLKNLFQSSTARTTTANNQPDPLNTRASSNTQTAGPNIQLGTTRAGGGAR